MQILRKIRAAFLYGKALKSFNQKKYNKALILFKKVALLESEEDRIEITYYYLGRSYLALKKNRDALKNFAKSYEMFNKKLTIKEQEDDIKYFIYLTNEYILLLNNMGKDKHANKIILDRNTLLSEKGYDISTENENKDP
jgi:tetratricopeptide (TPR) repeat protein